MHVRVKGAPPFLLCTTLLCSGCASPSRQPRLADSSRRIVLTFTITAALPDHPTHAVIRRAMARFASADSALQVQLAPASLLRQGRLPDVASVFAADLPELVARGGVEPLAAHFSGEWLRGFAERSLSQCEVGGVLFALPWLEGPQPSRDWLLISSAMSLYKPQAIQFMKFLTTDPVSAQEISRATGLRPARRSLLIQPPGKIR